MTQKLNIICRADGSHQIGLGHLMRMLALAQNLDPKRFSAHLITNSENLPPTFHAAFESITTAKKDYEEISRWSKDNTIIALDGYTFDLGYQTRLMQAGYKVALVSDYPQEVNCTLVLSNNGDLKASEYTHDPNTKFCLGAEYTLLQSAFLTSHVSKIDEPYIFIGLGGSDPYNFTNKILKSLANNSALIIKTVIGLHYQHHEELQDIIQQSAAKIEVHSNLTAEELTPLMADSTFGITSASTMALEFLSQNPNLYVVQTADNQYRLFNYLTESKLAAQLPQDHIPKALDNTSKIDFSKNPRRINSAFLGLFLETRPVISKDCQRLFDWANDKDTRSQSFNKNTIPLAEHTAWFNARLKDTNTLLLICELSGIPIGITRYTIEGTNATINYSLDKEYRGVGLAGQMVPISLEKVRQLRSLKQITAFVKESNIASLRIFEKLLFTKTKAAEYADSFKFTLPIK